MQTTSLCVSYALHIKDDVISVSLLCILLYQADKTFRV